jgi:very-short-patch-repair endonuclease
MTARKSPAQLLLATHLRELVGDEPLQIEYKFLPDRKFRFDLALPDLRIGIECDGGQFSGGHRHNVAIERDYEKANLAQMNEWKILRFTNRQVLDGTAKKFLKEWL